MPEGEIVPHATLVQPEPATAHETPVLRVFVTKAARFTVLLPNMVAVLGVTLTNTGNVGSTVAEAVPFELSACEVAVTVTLAGLGTLAGALYTPLAAMEPQARPLQPAPETDQVTAVLLVPLTAAVNNWLFKPFTLALGGETVIETTGGGGVGVGLGA